MNNLINNNKKNKKVFVGVSGGVDSSVSVALLLEQKYDVVGVFIRTWNPDFIKCTWQDERRDAMRICAHFDIPFLECDAEIAYKKGVVDYMIDEYKKGRTPNPDVMCNREVKFGIFWDFAKSNGADYIATGHYAVCDLLHTDSSFQSSLTPFLGLTKNGTPTSVASQGLSVLRMSPDSSKDQSYFLWTLTQYDLSHTLFPIGHLKKSEVRTLARKYKIPVAEKKDSQGVCFLGQLDMKDFLKHFIEIENGDVLNKEGEIIGSHDGAVFFTLGERHGFSIIKKSKNNLPYYVIAKDIKNNTITVSHTKDKTYPTDPLVNVKQGRGLKIINTNWIAGIIPIKNKKYTAQIRYHGELFSCTVNYTDNNYTEIIFEENVLVDSGQSIVVYDGDICLGGGIVE